MISEHEFETQLEVMSNIITKTQQQSAKTQQQPRPNNYMIKPNTAITPIKAKTPVIGAYKWRLPFL